MLTKSRQLLAVLLATMLLVAAFSAGVFKQSGVVLGAFARASGVAVQLYAGRVGLALYANTITNLIPILYAALDIVSRELVGFIPAVARDSSAERAALNQTVNIFVTPAATTGDITPGVTAPNDGDQVIANQTMLITKSKYAPIRWAGEEQKAVQGSQQQQNVIRDQFTQAMRALVNLVEIDLAVAAYQGGSRATGTPGTAPFGTVNDLSDSAGVMRILDDNGAPLSERQLVLGTAAIQNIRAKQAVLFRVNESGTADLLRNGVIGRLEGLDIHTSAGVRTPTKGTGSAYTTTAAGFAIGTTVIPLITGTGTILVGDVVTFAGDTNKYIVNTGIAAPGSITLALPGLLQAIPTAATAVTVGNTAAQNAAFYRGAIQLATRAPALPIQGDMAEDVMEITDPVSGLAFQVAMYLQYRQVRWEVGLAWGVKVVKAEHVTILLG
jgi:hypothetical protein